MSRIPTLEGVRSRFVDTPRLRMHILETGPAQGEPVVLVHGNASSSTFFEELMLALGDRYHVIAPDMRGYGETELKPVDATRGARDHAEDLAALLDSLGIVRPVHLLGWSLGAGWATQLMLDHPARVKSLTLEAPVSPYGFGGTVDVNGRLAFEDAASSGAGGVAPDFPQRIKDQDRGTDSPLSPRNVLLSFYFKPPFKPAREEELVSSILLMAIDEGNYPGDAVPSPNWPTVAPGRMGVLNAFCPLYYNVTSMVDLAQKPPILWIRGADDQVVSNTSFWDVAFLGQLGAIPGWPGADVLPPQPMIDQTRAVLEAYAQKGGHYREVVLESCGHSPHLEHPDRFLMALRAQLAGA